MDNWTTGFLNAVKVDAGPGKSNSKDDSSFAEIRVINEDSFGF